ncbi:Glycosyl transferase family 2 [anaerobic digester metagenome]
MQKTDFEIEVLIHDDASTDGTIDIIKEYQSRYPEIIKPIFETSNQWIKGRRGSVVFNLPRAKGKYFALCEGDDYWTDPYKLQKQVDYLEANPNYVFSCHRFKIFNECSNEFLIDYSHKYYNEADLIIDTELFFRTWITQPLTAVIRKNELLQVVEETRGYDLPRDVHIFYYLLKKGNGIALNQFMGVYRWHDNGVSSMVNFASKFVSGYKIYGELFYKNRNDHHLRQKFFYSLIGYLRYGKKSSIGHNYRVYSEGKSLTTDVLDRVNLLVSFITPRFIFNLLATVYNFWRISRSSLVK